MPKEPIILAADVRQRVRYRPYVPSQNQELYWTVFGPRAPGYSGHTLNPDLSCRDELEAKRCAVYANLAYEVGYLKAMENLRLLIGAVPLHGATCVAEVSLAKNREE